MSWPESLTVGAPRRTVPAGTVLFRRDEPADSVWLLVRGRVALRRQTAAGTPLTLGVFRDGETVAGAGLFSRRYHCDAVAEVDSEVLVLDAARVLTTLGDDPGAGLDLVRALCREVQELRALIEVRGIRRADERLLAWLLMQQPPGADAVTVDRPWVEIASEIGLVPETLYRTLSRLEDGGRLRRRGRRIDLIEIMSARTGSGHPDDG